MSTPPTIPQETINQIIEEIEPTPDNARTLRSCALTASSFRDPAQRQMLRVLHVYLDEAHKNKMLAEVLASSMRLCNFVEELCFYLSLEGWITGSMGSLPTFPTLKRMQRITLKVANAQCRYAWTSLPAAFPGAFREIVQWPTLRELSIKGAYGFPTTFLNHCFHLQRLDFLNVSFITDPFERVLSSPPSDIPNQGYIDLSIDGPFTPVRSLVSTLKDQYSVMSLARIRKFRIGIRDLDDFIHFRAIFDLNSCSSLEELELSVHPGAESVDFNLSCLPALRRLRIEAHMSAISAVPRLLESLPTTTNTCEISISVGIAPIPSDCNVSGNPIWSLFRRVDEMFAAERRTPCLKVVELNLIKSGPISNSIIRDATLNSMPQLFTAGRLLVRALGADSKKVDIITPLGTT